MPLTRILVATVVFLLVMLALEYATPSSTRSTAPTVFINTPDEQFDRGYRRHRRARLILIGAETLIFAAVALITRDELATVIVLIASATINGAALLHAVFSSISWATRK